MFPALESGENGSGQHLGVEIEARLAGLASAFAVAAVFDEENVVPALAIELERVRQTVANVWEFFFGGGSIWVNRLDRVGGRTHCQRCRGGRGW